MSAVRYREPGRTYLSTSILAAVIVLGFVLDLAVGQGVHHIVGWAIALVIVVGCESLTVYAARVMRTITITDDEIAVGEEVLPRSDVRSVTGETESEDRVLGRRYATGLPRGAQGVGLELADGSRVVLATRHPDRIFATLGAEAPAVPAELRVADADDLPLLPEIDDRADSVFRVSGYDLPEFDPAPDHPVTKRVFVVGRPPVGFVELAEVDGEGYVAEVAVLPGEMRKGYGSALMRAACDWAREQGYRGIALTTFDEIAWNGPFYRRLGFTEVTEPGPGLRRIREHEAEVGLDAVATRVVLRLAL